MKFTVLPLLEDVNSSFEIDLSKHPRTFCELLDARKAVVLSKSSEDASSVLSVQDFADTLLSLHLSYYPYIGGAAPRTVIPVEGTDLPIVFTANESPPDQPIRK
jgi:hypothetical protein